MFAEDGLIQAFMFPKIVMGGSQEKILETTDTRTLITPEETDDEIMEPYAYT